MTRRLVALLTVAAIAGTLCGCGRYGKPKRPAPEPAAASSLSVTPVAGLAVPPDETRR